MTNLLLVSCKLYRLSSSENTSDGNGVCGVCMRAYRSNAAPLLTRTRLLPTAAIRRACGKINTGFSDVSITG